MTRLITSRHAFAHPDGKTLNRLIFRRRIKRVHRFHKAVAVRYTRENTLVETDVRRDAPPMSTHGGHANETREYAAIRVRNQGPGVPEASLERLFDPFYRVADARDRQSGGVGLGLSIAARAVRFHGGDVSAVNADGGGLLVEIRLPLALD